MGIKIKQLPPIVANQIAAGEVIERPASVVKELLENALDAGADSISIEIFHGGLNKIKISDNGVGIFPEDLPLAILPHATSKISQLDDLYAIESMGFRGEALASIASIAKFSLSSKTQDQEHALQLDVVEEQPLLSPCARSQGTTVEVIDLFYNAPVRKRFLKSEKLEFLAIETLVKRFALSAPHVTIHLKHNDKIILNLSPGICEKTKQQRISKIFGNTFMQDAIYFEAKHEHMQLSGWLSGRNYQRSQNDRQWIYINQRMVKDKLLLHALKQSYEDIIYPGRFPACLLYFTLNTSEVDVNVHPTKHEVRFEHPRIIHDFFVLHIKDALYPMQSANLPPLHQYGFERREQTLISEPKPPFAEHKIPIQDSTKIDRSMNRGDVKAFNTHSWITLNKKFGLFLKDKKSYLIDIQALQYYKLEKHLANDKILTGRALLVPFRVHFEDLVKAKHIQEKVILFGITLVIKEDNYFLIESIPYLLPQLDVREFLNYLFNLESISPESLIKALCRFQCVDAEYMSIEEKQELLGFLENESENPKFCKQLTEEVCREWLYA